MTKWSDALPHIPNLIYEHTQEIAEEMGELAPPPEPEPKTALVILESPFAGASSDNYDYLQLCIRDAIERGESPYASHQMLTGALNDRDPKEREKGIQAGFAWHSVAEYVVVYTDLGVSPGMMAGIEHATELQKRVFFRQLQ